MSEQVSKNDQMLSQEYCVYQPPHCRATVSEIFAEKCSCSPPMDQHQCHCAGLSNRWAKESLVKRKRQPKQRGLIAYLRDSGTGEGLAAQRKVIDDFCQDNEYYIKAVYTDHGKPGGGLQSALQAVESADGLIASDLDRFVEHYSDRLRDIRPFVHHFFCSSSKHLITVEEGVDTGSISGQFNVVEIMNQIKDHC